MSRIFLSHSSADNGLAIALRDWLVDEGWNDFFLDLDPERGIAAGERWERALNEAARRCEAVLFLISRAWLSSRWCINELSLARRLNKRLFGILIEEGLSVRDLPSDVTSTWQLVNLAAGRDHKQFRVTLPITGEEVHVTYSLEGLARLKNGLQRAGLHADYFNWPPEYDLKRPPYRGLRPLEADDAGIFFGREAPVIEAVDRLRGLREAAPPRLLVIVGASGAGKSSFLRAGLLPRLARDDAFLPLQIIRPARMAISGETGLLRSLEAAFEAAKLKTPRAELRSAIEGGAWKLKSYLQALVDKAIPVALDGEAKRQPPALMLAIDQAEELFLTESEEEARPFLTLLRDLLATDGPAVMVILTIRSDNYERLQQAHELADVHKVPFDLGPMAKGSYAEVIKGPVRRLEGTTRALRIDDALVDALLADIEAGGAKDALPLLAFTLERLYGEYHGGGHLKLEHYNRLGRVRGSIEAAVERAFKEADTDARIPNDRQDRLILLRRGLIPWLAGVDPDTGAPRRRVARLSEIPEEARPIIDQLVEQRLLSTDVAKHTGERTIEPAHEALLRQWGLLQGWLAEDTGLLNITEGVKRAARDWAANCKGAAWLVHSGDRLAIARALDVRWDISGMLEPTDRDYLAACSKAELATLRAKRRGQVVLTTLLIGIIAGLIGWINQDLLQQQLHWYVTVRPYVQTNITPYVLKPEVEHALKPGQTFQECAKDCPQMVVLPAGEFLMGSPVGTGSLSEYPRHKVNIKAPFAVSKFEVTFDDWEACVALRGCPSVSDNGYGKGNRPVINVSWNEAKQYVAWLSQHTGKTYRLLSEAEWEYAARGLTSAEAPHPAYPWGDTPSHEYANYGTDVSGVFTGKQEVRDQWINTAPVGQFPANAFGLHDMHGNVWEWVEDPWHDNYRGAPTDGSARLRDGDPGRRVRRGGAWDDNPRNLRSALRLWVSTFNRSVSLGFRVARTISPGTDERIVASNKSLPSSGASSSVTPEADFIDTLHIILAALAPSFPSRDRQVRTYLEAPPHKALAVYPPSSSWRTSGWGSKDNAGEGVLEGCQMRHGAPCILIAIDATILVDANTSNFPRRMPRVDYDGLYEPQQIPAVREARKSDSEVARYRDELHYKAAAIHPWGKLFLAVGADTQRSAEQQVLAACNLDPARNSRDGPCFLYAVGDQVVLPRRLTAPVSVQ